MLCLSHGRKNIFRLQKEIKFLELFSFFLFFFPESVFNLYLIFSFLLQGYVPLFVNATAGTTVFGAFDPIQEIADICEKYNLWLHVDVSN